MDPGSLIAAALVHAISQGFLAFCVDKHLPDLDLTPAAVTLMAQTLAAQTPEETQAGLRVLRLVNSQYIVLSDCHMGAFRAWVEDKKDRMEEGQ